VLEEPQAMRKVILNILDLNPFLEDWAFYPFAQLQYYLFILSNQREMLLSALRKFLPQNYE
jgi:hypothetical protein